MNVKKIKRLCVYVIYDKEKIIDGYVAEILISLKKADCNICIVCNMNKISKGEENLSCASYLFFRDNFGLDVGAWKDVLCSFLGWDELSKYDEIILANDSFYGSFYPFSEMISFMDEIAVDFWGITEHMGNVYYSDILMPRHLQSYFICIRKNMFSSDAFRNYWESLSCPVSIDDAILGHEIVFTQYFEERGFTSTSYMAEKGLKIPQGVCAFYGMNYKMIKNGRSPVLKKKSIRFFADGLPDCIIDTLDALDYVESETLYDTSLIWDNLHRLCRNGSFHPGFSFEKIDAFCNKCERIFLYGAGEYSKRVHRYLEYRGYRVTAIFDSYRSDPEKNIILFSPDKVADSDGIIISVSAKYCKEIFDMLRRETNCRVLCADYE